jgi:hypothetical protein
MYGVLLWLPDLDIPEGYGQVSNGLAIGSGNGTSGLMPPTLTIASDGTKTFDGTAVEFHLAPHTEAPAEMAMLFPDYRSLCLAEICNQTQHNVLTPRGAEVRDTLAWSDALDGMMKKWVDTGRVDSAWGPHTWPRWGSADVAEYVGKQSRLYRYIHDQTVFLMNSGYDMTEVAEAFTLPDDLAKEWFNRGYYGALNFNVKAVYQKYLGWFDSNAATLWKLPEKTSAELWAKYLPRSGGDLVKAAKLACDDGQYRWAVEVLEKVRLAREDWGAAVYAEAKALQADAFEQMAYEAESGIWRNYFLTAAWRNRNDAVARIFDSPASITMGPDTVSNMTTGDILNTISTQINGFTGASSFTGTVLWVIRDGEAEERHESRMEDHVLWTRAGSSANPDVTICLTREELNEALGAASAGTSWLDALLANQNAEIDGQKDILTGIAGLTHIDPPALPQADIPQPVNPAPDPEPVTPPAVDPARSATDISGVRIGGVSYNLERQADGSWLIAVPYGTNLSKLALDFMLPHSETTVSPTNGSEGDFSGGRTVIYTVKSADGAKAATYRVRVIARENSAEDGGMTAPSASEWTLSASRNADGAFNFTLNVPTASSITSSRLPSDIYVSLAPIYSNMALAILDAGGNVIAPYPDLSGQAGEPKTLRVTGTAENRAALEELSITQIYWLSANENGKPYAQTLNPAITYFSIPEENKNVEGGSGHGGCDAGLGIAGIGMAILLPGLLPARRRRVK